MFNIFKTKELNEELLVENVTNSIISQWVNSSSLRYENFAKVLIFSLATNDKTVLRFMREKLRLLTAVAIISLVKDQVDEATIHKIIDKVIHEVRGMDDNEILDLSDDLKENAKAYSKIRTQNAAKVAGKNIELEFANKVFRVPVSESDVDAMYCLYKNLSSMERKAIFSIKSAIGKSCV